MVKNRVRSVDDYEVLLEARTNHESGESRLGKAATGQSALCELCLTESVFITREISLGVRAA